MRFYFNDSSKVSAFVFIKNKISVEATKIDYKYEVFSNFIKNLNYTDDFDEIDFYKSLTFKDFLDFYNSLSFDNYNIGIVKMQCKDE